MQTKKTAISEEERREIDPNNKHWLEEYIENSGDPKGYFGKVREFLEFCEFSNPKPANQLTVDTDINKYISALKKNGAQDGTINSRLSAIAGFRKYLINEHNFDEKFLANLPMHEKPGENPKDTKPLNLRQLAYARKYNCRNIKDEYIFELFFQLNIDKNDLVDKNYENTKNIQVIQIIEKAQKAAIEVKLGTITSYFRRLTKELIKKGLYDKAREINSYDLGESHKLYFRKCPNCGEGPFENTPNNWVLAKIQFDNIEDQQDEYHIVCIKCKGEAQNAN